MTQLSLRWLIGGATLAILTFTLALWSLGIYWSLEEFLWRSQEVQLVSQAYRTWYREETDTPRTRRGSLPASEEWPHDAGFLARSIATPGVFVRMLEEDGSTILAEAGRLGRNAVQPPPLPSPAQLAESKEQPRNRRRRATSLKQGEHEWQMMVVPIVDKGDQVRGYLQLCGLYRQPRLLLTQVASVLLIGGLVAAALAAAATFVVASWLTVPIERLRQAANRIREGDLSARTGLTSGPGREVYGVAHTFDQMASQLQESFQKQRRFVADASHELKTPLTAIGGMAEMLSLDPPPEKRQLALKTIEKEVDRMSHLVQDLLMLSRTEQPERHRVQPTNLADIAKDAVERVFTQRKVHLDAQSAPMQGDPEALGRAIRNLVDNALHYSSEDVEVQTGTDDKGVFVKVVDRGQGISEQDLPHLFERFYRADPSRTRQTGGSGLGLAIVQAIVDQHQGKIEVQSKVGQGSTFTMRFPNTK